MTVPRRFSLISEMSNIKAITELTTFGKIIVSGLKQSHSTIHIVTFSQVTMSRASMQSVPR